MTAGKPDYQKLFAMGKLPKEARGNVPMLDQLDKAEMRIKELEEENAKLKVEQKPGSTEVPGLHPSFFCCTPFMEQCQVKGCLYAAQGRTEGIAKSNLRLHGRTHASDVDSTLNPNEGKSTTTGQA